MITLETQGFDEAIARIQKWIGLLNSSELWIPATRASADVFRGYAQSISPVVTGSYRASHTVFTRGMGAIMTIDPGAMNRGTPVTDYAGAVERKHSVYRRTAQGAMGRAGQEGIRLLRGRFR